MSELTEQEQDLLNHYRETIMSMSYAPLSDDELSFQKARLKNAEASATIEGLYGNPMDDALFNLFKELRALSDVCLSILREHTRHQKKSR